MNKSKTLTLGSLFDGSGGFPLAGILCGITPVWASEIEPYPVAVTKTHFPNMKHLGDVSKICGRNISPVDIITFGSPCQDLSVAGKRSGLKHESLGDDCASRSGLFMEAIRIIREMRETTKGEFPKYALWENVPGAFSSNKGEDFRIVLEEFVKIVEPNATMPPANKNGWPYADIYVGDGWSLAYRTLDAQYWGVPQRRRRIFLVFDFTGERAGEILFKQQGLRRDFAEIRKTWEATSGNAENCVRKTGDNGYKGELIGDTSLPISMNRGMSTGRNGILTNTQYLFENHSQGSCYRGPLEVCPTLLAKFGTGGNTQPFVLEGSYFNIDSQPDVAYGIGNGQANQSVSEEMVGTLNCMHDQQAICYGVDCRNIYESPEPYQPLQAKPNGGYSLNYSGAVRYQYMVRRITPTECAKLQGFPDWWGSIEKKERFSDEEFVFWNETKKIHASINGKTAKNYSKDALLKWYNKLHTDSAEYKMWGNGIALPTALYVMEGISDSTR